MIVFEDNLTFKFVFVKIQKIIKLRNLYIYIYIYIYIYKVQIKITMTKKK